MIMFWVRLHVNIVFILSIGMRNGLFMDDALLSIIEAGHGQFVKMHM